ncbi:hypothetical protein [Fusobacterium sp. IOR10]|uniref:hypothetical protein n=1 Tax=Fusobacterium sp. IOR10 TaxID=2665157 RepID=UPI0013CF98F5|nr:hypothetical protein [Fusobacterium sp. IOR10]
MFTNLLLEEEKSVFLKLLVYLSKIDNELSTNEVNFIKKAGHDIGIEVDNNIFDLKVGKLEDLLFQFKSKRSKKILLIELINIALADNNYSVEERGGILEISRILEISKNEVINIENWVVEGNKWISKGSKIILD